MFFHPGESHLESGDYWSQVRFLIRNAKLKNKTPEEAYLIAEKNFLVDGYPFS